MTGPTEQPIDAVIYRITHPNGKVYIGREMTNSINDFGSASSALIAADFPTTGRRSFTITRDILWASCTATLGEGGRMEAELIRKHEANNPQKGHNRWPRWLTASAVERLDTPLTEGEQG